MMIANHNGKARLRGTRTLWMLGLLVAAWLCPSRASADIAYTQPPNPAGGQYKSAWYPPDGLDSDERVWDAFTLASNTAITEIHWRGAYTNYLSGAGKAPVFNFTVAICGSTAGNTQPDVVNPPLVEYETNGNAGETLAGTFGGVQMYDYAFVLPSAFQAAAGTKYWVQIVAWQGLTPTYSWPPDWSFARGTGGDGSHFRRVGGTGGMFNFITGDLAFTLMSSSAQTFTISASANPTGAGTIQGTGVYPTGSNATLTATANPHFGFVNWTENGSPVSSNASYTFAVTRDRTLVANFTDAYTITTDSIPLYAGTTGGGGAFNSGAMVTVTAVPHQGFVFDTWLNFGVPVSTSAVWMFPAAENMALAAVFVPEPTTVVFDLDSGEPPPQATMTATPFDNTVDGVTAYFSSPQGGFSLQNDGTIGWSSQVELLGNYLWPNSVIRNDLRVRFSRLLTGIALDFATVEMEAWADTPSPLVLTAWRGATAVGTAQASGVYNYPTTTYPEGYVAFSSSVPFDSITLTVGANPFGTNNFLSDNFVVVVQACRADYNGDGFLDGIDYDLFNNDFESTDPQQQMNADYNGDGFVDGIDYDQFMNDFSAGC